MATSAVSDMLRQKVNAQQEFEEKWCEWIRCRTQGVYTIGLCVSRFSSEKIYSSESRKIGIKSHR